MEVHVCRVTDGVNLVFHRSVSWNGEESEGATGLTCYGISFLSKVQLIPIKLRSKTWNVNGLYGMSLVKIL